jgi:hypothetical protein
MINASSASAGNTMYQTQQSLPPAQQAVKARRAQNMGNE